MGEKKQVEKTKKNLTKALAIIAGVLFVVLMIVSSMGTGWITGLAGVKSGDVVVLDYTLKDAKGNPLVTSDQTLYKQIVASGYDVLLSKQMTITANQSLSHPIFPMQVYTSQSGWGSQYGMFASEYNAIGSGIMGMKANEKKTISVASGVPMTQFWTADQLLERKLNLSEVQVGYVIPLGVSENQEAMTDNSTATYYIRLGEITKKTTDGVTIDFAHPIVDVSVVTINKR
jgi:FKBP-type peptidyl-prolyl cis-trans isomerase 2